MECQDPPGSEPRAGVVAFQYLFVPFRVGGEQRSGGRDVSKRAENPARIKKSREVSATDEMRSRPLILGLVVLPPLPIPHCPLLPFPQRGN